MQWKPFTFTSIKHICNMKIQFFYDYLCENVFQTLNQTYKKRQIDFDRVESTRVYDIKIV